MQVFDDVFIYGSEFHGIQQTLSITPTMEKTFLAVWLAISLKRPVFVQGDSSVGKTTSITVLSFL